MNSHDHLTIYCRMLGHEVPFSYCRQPGSSRVCRNIRSCWGEILDIDSYLQKFFTPQELEEAFAPKEDKLTTLVKLIERAKKGNE